MNIALYGSGEFTAAVNEIDEYLIDKYAVSSVAVIPTAAGKERDYRKWTDMAKSHYEHLGINVIPVPIIDSVGANDNSLVGELDKADWIFFSGGDPKYLLDTVRDTKLWDKVMERVKNGALLAGSSAGAMIMGKYVLSNPFKALFTTAPAAWDKAFGLAEYTIIPHYNRVKSHKRVLQKIIDKGPIEVQKSWVGIDENTALIIDSSGSTVKGMGTIDLHTS